MTGVEPNFARIENAKEATRQRIADAVALASVEVAALLREIAARIFTSGFDVAALERAVKPSKQAVKAFKAETGLTRGRYLKEQRMRTARQLLETTDVLEQRIARETCAASERRFPGAYRQWSGKTPGEVRAAVGRSRHRGRLPVEDESRRLWFRTGLYALTPEELQAARRITAEQREAKTREWGEVWPRRWMAGLEVYLTTYGATEMRKFCAQLGLMEPGARSLFETLGELSRSEGRKDRWRGVELAEVALGVAEGSGVGELLGLGWARLGNAFRVAADFDEAEKALRQAERWSAKDVGVVAEILCYRGSLRFYQRRFLEAETLLNKAIIVSREAKLENLEVGALQQRAHLRWYQGKPQAGIPDLYIALDRAKPADLRARFVSTQLLLLLHVTLENHQAAAELLPEAYKLVAQIDDEPSALQVRWLEGLYCRSQGELSAADRLLQEARTGFAKLQDGGMRAIVALDLALLAKEQGQASEVLEYASEALAGLETLRLPEAIPALHLLRQALAARQVQRSVIEEARRCLLGP